MTIVQIEIPVHTRWRRPWAIRLAPVGVVFGFISCRLMALWLRAILRLACLECQVDGAEWQPVAIDVDVDCSDDDDDDRGGGDWAPAYAWGAP